MKKLFAIGVLLLVASATPAQVRVDWRAEHCLPLQEDASCTLVAHDYLDAGGAARAQIWTQDCLHTQSQGFGCHFNWPLGAALTGTGKVGITIGLRGDLDGDAGELTQVCTEATLYCRAITGTGNEDTPFAGTGSIAWSVPALEVTIGESIFISYIGRADSTGDLDDLAPGAAGASCELRIKRNVTGACGPSAEYTVGYEYLLLDIPGAAP
jgi:hypothetical protein